MIQVNLMSSTFTLRADQSQHKYFRALSSRYYSYIFTQCPSYLYQPWSANNPAIAQFCPISAYLLRLGRFKVVYYIFTQGDLYLNQPLAANDPDNFGYS